MWYNIIRTKKDNSMFKAIDTVNDNSIAATKAVLPYRRLKEE